MIKVCKFGGSSLANSKQFKKIKKIVNSEEDRKVIIASACGKSNKNDHKVTDLLYLCIAHKKYGMSYESILDEIKNKHLQIINDLKLNFDLDKEIKRIKSLLDKNGNVDEILSFGEYLSSKLLSLYLKCDYVDAKDVICFNYDGSINLEKTKESLLKYLKTNKKIVIPGFYGSLPNGVIKIMSRGGSDITGSIIANVIDADIYENWTDVSGIYVCDPRIISNPKKIELITYSELREMSYMGANVLHEEAIYPVKNKNIPINIRNTNDYLENGTLIVSNTDNKKTSPISGITGKKDFLVISIAKINSSNELGFLKRILDIFDNYRIPVVLVTTAIDSFSIILDKSKIKNDIYEVSNEIKTSLKCDEVSLYDNLSLVCVVGRGMKDKKGISGKIFSLLGENDINIRTISQGADEISIIVGVDDDNYEKTIKCIYERFVK